MSPEHSAVSSVGKLRCGTWRVNRLEYYKILDTRKKPVSLYPSAEEEQTLPKEMVHEVLKKGKKDASQRARAQESQGSKWNCRKIVHFGMTLDLSSHNHSNASQMASLGPLNVNNTTNTKRTIKTFLSSNLQLISPATHSCSRRKICLQTAGRVIKPIRVACRIKEISWNDFIQRFSQMFYERLWIRCKIPVGNPVRLVRYLADQEKWIFDGFLLDTPTFTAMARSVLLT